MPSTVLVVRDAAQQETVHLQRLSLPEYALDARLFYRAKLGEPRYLETDRWAEPLEQGIGRVLANALDKQLENALVTAYPNAPATETGARLRLQFYRLEAIEGRGVFLDVVFEVRGAGEAPLVRKIQLASGNGDYQTSADIVAELHDALVELATHIAELL